MLSNKSVLFCGDSIAAGWRDSNGVDDYSNSGGWAKRISDNYGMNVSSAAIAGSTISLIRIKENRAPIVNQLHKNQNKDFAYIIIQGGINDAMGTNAERTKESAAKIGKMTNSFDLFDFDTWTFAGALEQTFYYANKYFPCAKKGFIVTYATPLSTHGGYTSETNEMRKYWGIAKRICNKWDIMYLDLFDGITDRGLSYSLDVLKTDTDTYFPGAGDYVHLNSVGYDIITPYIYKWMMKL